MAGSTRFELAAGSPEGSAFAATYPNGQRGNYSSASLDRSGSFREGSENRSISSGPGSTRGSTALSSEMPPSQFLTLEPITLGDQKFARSVELRRLLGVSHVNISEDHLFGSGHSKPPSPEDLKRFKGSVLDTSSKARERAKKLNESIGKLDRYRQSLLQRKRRTESSERSGGAAMLRTGSQMHQNPPDLVTQRLEDRTKNVVLNKRARTSIADVRSEGRNAVPIRQPTVIGKDRDMLGGGGRGSVQVEEKIRGLPAAGEGWDKKMKRKRSVGNVVTRAMDGDRELQQRAMLQKHLLKTDAHGFGPVPSNGTTGIKQLDGTSQPTTSNVRSIPRNEPESVSFSNDRRERTTGMDKERVIFKGNKVIREDSQGGSPSPVTKGKASRAPRSGSGVANSPNFSRTPGSLDGWDQTSCVNKAQPVSGPTNRKRPIPTGSSSPPMAQWVGQRPQKISRNRRANLVSPVSNHDEAQVSSEGLSAPDSSTKLTSSETNGSLLPKGATSNGQQFKMKFENVLSPARLSESEESGAGENRLKDKGTVNDEIEERSVNAVPKVGPFLLPKNRKEEIGDGVRRQGRTGRGSSIPRTSIPQARDKLENSGTTKPLQNVRAGPDKSESKSGRPPSKKVSDRKAYNRQGNVLNSGSSDMTGESDDDHEELATAAKSAHNARYLACSGSFWKKMEPVFGSVSPDDVAYLKRQLSFAEELDESLSQMLGADFTSPSELAQNKVSSSQSKEGQVHVNGVGSKGPPWNLGSMDELQDTGDLIGKFEKATPLYQRVLSALIEEDEIEEVDRSSELRRVSFQYTSDGSPSTTFTHMDAEHKDGVRVLSDVDSEVEWRNQNNCLLDNFSCDGSTASNSFRSSSNHGPLYNEELWPGDDNLVNSEVGVISGFSKKNLDTPLAAHTNNAVNNSVECQYEQMSLDDKLLLELQSIGLYPDTMPDLTEGEEEINKDIAVLKEGLYRQVGKKKLQLCKIDEVIQKGKEEEERYLEQSAMNKLVEMAYKKRLACRGNNASKNGVSKTTKQAALGFVKRTIARCRKFEDTGESCFREAALRDIIFSAATYIGDDKLAVGAATGASANTCIDAHNTQPESRTSALGGSLLVERHSPLGDKFDRGSLDGFQARTHSSNQSFVKTEMMTNRGKKKEVLLDDVTGSGASRASAALANSPLGGAKGRRSERERDQNKYGSTRNAVAKAGRPALGGFRGERKTKTKPKQKTAQLSMSGNGLLGRSVEAPNPVYPSGRDPNEKANDCNSSKVSREEAAAAAGGFVSPGNDSSKEAVDPGDFANLQLPDIDPIEDLGVSTNLPEQNDLSSWLNFDEDGLQDHDSMGLEIPMDDLSDLQMLI